MQYKDALAVIWSVREAHVSTQRSAQRVTQTLLLERTIQELCDFAFPSDIRFGSLADYSPSPSVYQYLSLAGQSTTLFRFGKKNALQRQDPAGRSGLSQSIAPREILKNAGSIELDCESCIHKQNRRVQDRYNLSVPNVLLRAFWLPTVPQNQPDTSISIPS